MSRTVVQALAMRKPANRATTRSELLAVIAATRPFGDESRTDLLGLAQLAAEAIVDAEAELAAQREELVAAETLIRSLSELRARNEELEALQVAATRSSAKSAGIRRQYPHGH